MFVGFRVGLLMFVGCLLVASVAWITDCYLNPSDWQRSLFPEPHELSPVSVLNQRHTGIVNDPQRRTTEDPEQRDQ